MEIIIHTFMGISNMLKQCANNEKGFTLIEIAIVMVIIGLLAGGGVSLMGMLSERKMRNETAEYLNDAKNALINYAKIHGRLPWADNINGDGWENNLLATGELPYLTLGMKPRDANSRFIKYALNNNIGTDRSTSCSTLRPGLPSGSIPSVVDSDGSAIAFPVAAVLISAGPKDADNDGNVFDDITGTPQGDNTNGNPNYIRHPPNDTFDDLVVYISGYSLYGEICGDGGIYSDRIIIPIKNRSSNDVYVYNTTESSDIAMILPGTSITHEFFLGDTIELCLSPGGCGTTVTSTPSTPRTIDESVIFVDIP